MIIIFKRYAPRSHDPSVHNRMHTHVFFSLDSPVAGSVSTVVRRIRFICMQHGARRAALRPPNVVVLDPFRAPAPHHSASTTTTAIAPSALPPPPPRLQHHHHYRHAISTTTTAAAPLAPPPPRRQQPPLRPVTAISNASPITPLPSSRHGYHHGRT